MKYGVIAFMLCSLAPVLAGEFGTKAGTVEVSGMGGLNVGPSDLGNHPVAGGDMQVYLCRWVSIGVGGGWAPLMNSSFGSGVNANANLYTYNGGVQIHGANSSRVTPYLAIGAGGIRSSAKATFGGVKYFGLAENAFAADFGGGFRAAVNRHFGLRLEVLAFKGRDTNIFGRALVGVYGQFGGR